MRARTRCPSSASSSCADASFAFALLFSFPFAFTSSFPTYRVRITSPFLIMAMGFRTPFLKANLHQTTYTGYSANQQGGHCSNYLLRANDQFSMCTKPLQVCLPSALLLLHSNAHLRACMCLIAACVERERADAEKGEREGGREANLRMAVAYIHIRILMYIYL